MIFVTELADEDDVPPDPDGDGDEDEPQAARPGTQTAVTRQNVRARQRARFGGDMNNSLSVWVETADCWS
jgi:hypothetical protein